MLSDMMREAPLPALLLRGDGVVVDANAAALGLLEMMVGRSAFADLVVEPKAAVAWAELSRGAPAEMALHRHGGGTAWVVAWGRPLAADLLVMLADVTALKSREAALLREKEAAEQAMQARLRYFAAASHDLRQPLQALALFVSALDRYIGPDGQIVLQSIRAALASMESMFNSLLDMSRVEAGILTAEPRVFMINDLLERVEDEFVKQAEAGGQELRVVPSSQAVHSDPALLVRILRNLVSNSVRHARRGRILLGCRRRGPNLRIEVWDTGPGIPDEQKRQIFEEFYSGPGGGVDKPPGIGLGLAIVQRLARLLDHRLGLCSVVGRGTMFSVEVPRAGDENVVADDEADEAELASPPDLAGACVLVVDDDQDILEGLRLLFEEWGCRAILATRVEDAVAAIGHDRLRPDVILADLRLGGSSCGIAAIKAIMNCLPTEVPALLFTGDTDTRELGERVEGRFPLLRKPIDPFDLRWVLGGALGRE